MRKMLMVSTAALAMAALVTGSPMAQTSSQNPTYTAPPTAGSPQPGQVTNQGLGSPSVPAEGRGAPPPGSANPMVPGSPQWQQQQQSRQGGGSQSGGGDAGGGTGGGGASPGGSSR